MSSNYFTMSQFERDKIEGVANSLYFQMGEFQMLMFQSDFCCYSKILETL